MGPKSIPQKKLTALGLATSIRQVIEEHGIRRRARELGDRLLVENGVGNAVKLVESSW